MTEWRGSFGTFMISKPTLQPRDWRELGTLNQLSVCKGGHKTWYNGVRGIIAKGVWHNGCKP